MKLSLIVLLFALVALTTARKSRRDSSGSSDSSDSSEKRGKGKLTAKLDYLVSAIKDQNVAREEEWRPVRQPGLLDSIRWSLTPRADRLPARWSLGRQDNLRPVRPTLQQVPAWNVAGSVQSTDVNQAWADALAQAKAEAQLAQWNAQVQAQAQQDQIAIAVSKPGRPGKPERPGKGRRPGQWTQASVQSTDVNQGWADAIAEAQLQAQQAQLQAQQAKIDAERAQAQIQQQQIQAQVAQSLTRPSKSNSGESGSDED